jgi:phosphopantothenoylcysteine decarboxylase/phosphopantothenate--cysteine ligase
MPTPKKTILITAGPTIEPIDPIRYISNYSTGVMGFELAKAAKMRGHKVILISGPVSLSPPKGVRFVAAKTALDMRREVLKFYKRADCVIMAAAVSDFRPASPSKKKIKKRSKKTFSLRLKRNPDILSELGRRKGKRVLIGYSLETERPVENAKKKLKSKNLDAIAVNRTGNKIDPFGAGAKDIAIIDRKGHVKTLRDISKAKIASHLINTIDP